MSHAITIRLSKELAAWVEQTAAKSGVSQGRLVSEQLEKVNAVAFDCREHWPCASATGLCVTRASAPLTPGSFLLAIFPEWAIQAAPKCNAFL